MAFEQGKQKLAKLEQLAQLKKDLSAIKKIELPKDATKEQSWKNYYNYLFEFARALRPIFQSDIQGENKFVALLKEVGCKAELDRNDADNLRFWAGFAHNSIASYKEVPDSISTKIKIQSIDLEYSMSLKQIAENPHMGFYENFFGGLKPGIPKTVDIYIWDLCRNMINNMDGARKKTITLLDEFLKVQEKPKTSIMDYFKASKTMDKE